MLKVEVIICENPNYVNSSLEQHLKGAIVFSFSVVYQLEYSSNKSFLLLLTH